MDEQVGLVRYSPEICELSRVMNHKAEDFISTTAEICFETVYLKCV